MCDLLYDPADSNVHSRGSGKLYEVFKLPMHQMKSQK